MRFKVWDKVKKWFLNSKKKDTILWFGKYKNKSIKEIVDRDAQYIEWCLNNRIFRLNFIVKLYYLKRLKYQKELKYKFLVGMYELEQKYGTWMDDGQGHCGFVNEEYYENI